VNSQKMKSPKTKKVCFFVNRIALINRSDSNGLGKVRKITDLKLAIKMWNRL